MNYKLTVKEEHVISPVPVSTFEMNYAKQWNTAMLKLVRNRLIFVWV